MSFLDFIEFNFISIIDIVLVAILMYQLYKLVRGTVAINIFIGLTSIYLLWKLVDALHMELLSEILGQFIGVGVIILVIVFQQELRKFLMHCANNAQRVFGSVEKIRIAERDMRCSGFDLLANIFQNDLLRQSEKSPTINGRDRTVGAKMEAASTGFGIASNSAIPIVLQACILLQGG